MPSPPKHVVFDIVGTLISYDHLFATINTQLGDRLCSEGIKPSLFGYTWIEVAEREYTYLSLSGVYTPFSTCFEAIFYRMLHFSGIASPRTFASDEDLAVCMQAYRDLKMREGAAECVRKLREAGFTVWALTAADTERVAGYFEAASVELPKENLLSCDEGGVGKPALEAYVPLLERLRKDGGTPWFAAAHVS